MHVLARIVAERLRGSDARSVIGLHRRGLS
jgi:hypothetical protein